MANEPERSEMPLLDEWIAEVGEEGVAAAVRATERDVSEGLIPSYDDADSLLRSWRRGRRQSA